jgi:hypothetical protein
MTQAHSTKSFRSVFGPRFVMRPRRSVSLDWYLDDVSARESQEGEH